ncbi:MAG: hypothetical protein AB7T10_00685 [bacterium]
MEKRISLLLSFVLILIFINLHSQISGFVFDSANGLPLYGVEVKSNGNFLCISDINGYFHADTPDTEEVSLSFSKDGYSKKVFKENSSSGFVTIKLLPANVDVYSSFTRYYRDASQLKYFSRMSSADNLNTLPGNVSGRYSRLGRDNFILYSLNSASIPSSREIAFFDYDRAIYSPSGYINSFSDNLSGRVDFITDDTFNKDGFNAELEGFQNYLSLGSGFRRFSLSYQNAIGHKTSYSIDASMLSSDEKSLLFMRRPSHVYANIDTENYAFKYTFYDYFVNGENELDSLHSTLTWTEDSIPFFSERIETLFINDTLSVVKRSAVLDTVIRNRFTDDYFDKTMSNPPHTATRDYSTTLSLKSNIFENALLGASLYLFSENKELYSSAYRYNEEDFASSLRNGYFLKASAMIYMGGSRSLSIQISNGYTHDKTAPSHIDTMIAIHDDGTTDTLFPKVNSPLEAILDPFNLFEYDDFMNLEYDTTPYYNDYPYMTLYCGYEGKYGYYIEKNTTTNALCVDYSMNFLQGNRITSGAGVKQKSYSQTSVFLPWDPYYFKDTYSTSSLFAYGYIRDAFERNGVFLDMNIKTDFVSRSGVAVEDSIVGESNSAVLSYRFGLRDMLNEYSSIRFSAERAIQQTDETYLFSYRTDEIFSNKQYGDPLIAPASSGLYDFGFAFDLPSGIYLNSSIFYREFENLINTVRIETVPSPYNIYKANGYLYGKGFEILCGLKRRYIDIEGSYTFSTCIESVDSLDYIRSFYPDYSSRHKINILHTFKMPFSKDDKNDLILSVNHSFRSGMPANEGDGNYYILPDLYLADLALIKQIFFENRSIHFYFNVSNLFNAETMIRVYSNTLDPDRDWTEELDADTFAQYRIGETGYDVRKDADRDGIVSSEENYDFTLGMYYDRAYNPYNYTTPREFSFGLRIGI